MRYQHLYLLFFLILKCIMDNPTCCQLETHDDLREMIKKEIIKNVQNEDLSDVQVTDMTRLDMRPSYSRVRNYLGAQVGRMSGFPVKLHQRNDGMYVLNVRPFEFSSKTIRKTYDLIGVGMRKTPNDPFYVVQWDSIDIDGDVYALVKMENITEGAQYSTVYLVSDYLTREPCNEDVCFVCDGTGDSCTDCKGVPFGNSLHDLCGICGGKNFNPKKIEECCPNGTVIDGKCSTN